MSLPACRKSTYKNTYICKSKTSKRVMISTSFKCPQNITAFYRQCTDTFRYEMSLYGEAATFIHLLYNLDINLRKCKIYFYYVYNLVCLCKMKLQ